MFVCVCIVYVFVCYRCIYLYSTLDATTTSNTNSTSSDEHDDQQRSTSRLRGTQHHLAVPTTTSSISPSTRARTNYTPRTTPRDLEMFLDAPNLRVFALVAVPEQQQRQTTLTTSTMATQHQTTPHKLKTTTPQPPPSPTPTNTTTTKPPKPATQQHAPIAAETTVMTSTHAQHMLVLAVNLVSFEGGLSAETCKQVFAGVWGVAWC